MRRILVADDHEITGADFDLQEILSVASELKDIPRDANGSELLGHMKIESTVRTSVSKSMMP